MGYDNLVSRESSILPKLIVGCGLGGLIGIMMLLAVGVGTNNSLVAAEEGIIAAYDNGENVHSNTFKKIQQAGFVTTEYSDKVKETIDAAIRGRYGSDGIKASMVWIKEDNPQISDDLFKRVLTIIEAGNNEFAATQTDRLDRIRVYRTKIRSFPDNMVAGLLGFPKLDLEKYGKVISVEGSKRAVETGVDAATNPFESDH